MAGKMSCVTANAMSVSAIPIMTNRRAMGPLLHQVVVYGDAMAALDPVALIDLDGTLADYDGAMKAALESLRSPHEPPLGEDFREAEPWLEARQRLIKRNPGFWLNLPKIPRGFEVVDILRTLSFRLMVLSKGPTKTPNAWS